MNAKSRVIVQPAGTLNKGRESTAEEAPTTVKTTTNESPQATISALPDAFDYSSLSKGGFQDDVVSMPAKSQPGDETTPGEAVSSPHPTGPTPEWVKAAEKDLKTGDDTSMMTKPAALILEDPKKGFNWMKFGVVIAIILCAIMAALIVIANTTNFGS